MLIAGADGCPGGWVVATADLDPDDGRCRALRAVATDRLDTFVAMTRAGSLAYLAIDMPIGLLDVHPRTADVEARRILGPRRSSVFPTPLSVVVAAADYEDACARSRRACGKALSKQAWNLMPKIRQLHSLIEADDQDFIAEAHPECAFLRLNNGEPLIHAKSTTDGRLLRTGLLQRSGRFDSDELAHTVANRVAPPVDLVDAIVLTITAAHVVCGSERRLGDQIDAAGRRAEIVY